MSANTLSNLCNSGVRTSREASFVVPMVNSIYLSRSLESLFSVFTMATVATVAPCVGCVLNEDADKGYHISLPRIPNSTVGMCISIKLIVYFSTKGI
jgi:hypothetical protein